MQTGIVTSLFCQTLSRLPDQFPMTAAADAFRSSSAVHAVWQSARTPGRFSVQHSLVV